MVARILKVVSALAALAALGAIVFQFRLWEKDWSTIDDGWASLIGSAIGAFLAVIGALYVSKAEERRKKKAFENFVRVAVQDLVMQASYLEAIAREPHKIAPNPDLQASIISIQQRVLTDALAVFDREIAHSKDGDYRLRSEVVRLDAMLSEVRHAFSQEADAQQILKNWHVGAYQVRQCSSSFLEAFGWTIPMPTAKLIAEIAQQSIRTWKTWNIPVGAVPEPPLHANLTRHQTVNHVAA